MGPAVAGNVCAGSEARCRSCVSFGACAAGRLEGSERGLLTQALDNASEEKLAAPAPQPGPPSADGKVSGTISFMAWHETYHIGQVSYLCCWLGHKGMMG